jgi:hypothetical protein
MAFAAIRFGETTRDIDSKEVQPAGGATGISHSSRCSFCWTPSYSSIWSTREPVGSELGAVIEPITIARTVKRARPSAPVLYSCDWTASARPIGRAAPGSKWRKIEPSFLLVKGAGPARSSYVCETTMVSIAGPRERRYGAGGEEMATSSLHLTEGVPRCPSRTTPACAGAGFEKIPRHPGPE